MAINRPLTDKESFKKVELAIKNDPNLQKIRKQVQKAVENSPKSITFEQAKKQVDKILNKKC